MLLFLLRLFENVAKSFKLEPEGNAAVCVDIFIYNANFFQLASVFNTVVYLI